MSVGAVPGISFYVPPLAKVSAVSKTRRVTRGGRVKGSGTFRLPDQDGESTDRPTADPAAASTSAATLAALASLTRGG